MKRSLPVAGGDGGERSGVEGGGGPREVADQNPGVKLNHPESFASKLGGSVMKELKKRDQVVLIAIDEFNTGSAWVPET
jgi:hypothetical protein